MNSNMPILPGMTLLDASSYTEKAKSEQFGFFLREEVNYSAISQHPRSFSEVEDMNIGLDTTTAIRVSNHCYYLGGMLTRSLEELHNSPLYSRTRA